MSSVPAAVCQRSDKNPIRLNYVYSGEVELVDLPDDLSSNDNPVEAKSFQKIQGKGFYLCWSALGA